MTLKIYIFLYIGKLIKYFYYYNVFFLTSYLLSIYVCVVMRLDAQCHAHRSILHDTRFSIGTPSFSHIPTTDIKYLKYHLAADATRKEFTKQFSMCDDGDARARGTIIERENKIKDNKKNV